MPQKWFWETLGEKFFPSQTFRKFTKGGPWNKFLAEKKILSKVIQNTAKKILSNFREKFFFREIFPNLHIRGDKDKNLEKKNFSIFFQKLFIMQKNRFWETLGIFFFCEISPPRRNSQQHKWRTTKKYLIRVYFLY